MPDCQPWPNGNEESPRPFSTPCVMGQLYNAEGPGPGLPQSRLCSHWEFRSSSVSLPIGKVKFGKTKHNIALQNLNMDDPYSDSGQAFRGRSI